MVILSAIGRGQRFFQPQDLGKFSQEQRIVGALAATGFGSPLNEFRNNLHALA